MDETVPIWVRLDVMRRQPNDIMPVVWIDKVHNIIGVIKVVFLTEEFAGIGTIPYMRWKILYTYIRVDYFIE